MSTDLKRRLKGTNYSRGHALELKPASDRPGFAKVKCGICLNALGRAICSICMMGLCRRHTITVDGAPYCEDHKPGYGEVFG